MCVHLHIYVPIHIWNGIGIGYAGLNNSVALEFDTWYDVGLSDLYNNHIALQTAVPGMLVRM